MSIEVSAYTSYLSSYYFIEKGVAVLAAHMGPHGLGWV